MEPAKVIEFEKQRSKDQGDSSPEKFGSESQPLAIRVLSRNSTFDDLIVDIPIKNLPQNNVMPEPNLLVTKSRSPDVELGPSNQQRISIGAPNYRRTSQTKKLFYINLFGVFLSLIIIGVGLFFCLSPGPHPLPPGPGCGSLPMNSSNPGNLTNGTRLLQGGNGPQGGPQGPQGGPQGPQGGPQGPQKGPQGPPDNNSPPGSPQGQDQCGDPARTTRIVVTTILAVVTGMGVLNLIIYLTGIIAIKKMSLITMKCVHSTYSVSAVLSLLTGSVWWCILNCILIAKSKSFLKELEDLSNGQGINNA